MNTTKLKEALVELQEQRRILDGAISNIQRIIATMNGDSETRAPTAQKVQGASYIDDSIRILEVAGEPLHIDELSKKLSELRQEKVERRSVESSFSRHILKTKHPRIVRSRAGFYGLSTWRAMMTQPKTPASN